MLDFRLQSTVLVRNCLQPQELLNAPGSIETAIPACLGAAVRQCTFVMDSHGVDVYGSVGQLASSLSHPFPNIRRYAYPLSIAFATLSPRPKFSVNTAAERPYSVSLAISIASCSLDISITETEGPNDSV